MVRDLENYEAIIFHKNISSIQRAAYNKHRTDLEGLKGKLLIEIEILNKRLLSV